MTGSSVPTQLTIRYLIDSRQNVNPGSAFCQDGTRLTKNKPRTIIENRLRY